MLAQNFLTAKQLGISQADYAAAVTVLGMLERGEITFLEKPRYTPTQSVGALLVNVSHCIRGDDLLCMRIEFSTLEASTDSSPQ